MASVCPPPFVLPPALPPTLPPTLPPSLPPFPQRRIRLLVPAEPHFIPPAIGLLLAQSEQYPALRRHAAARTPLTYPLRAAVMDELTQLESDLYAWSGDEALWAWLQSVHAEHNTALRLRLRDVSPQQLRIVLWSRDVGRKAAPVAC